MGTVMLDFLAVFPEPLQKRDRGHTTDASMPTKGLSLGQQEGQGLGKKKGAEGRVSGEEAILLWALKVNRSLPNHYQISEGLECWF